MMTKETATKLAIELAESLGPDWTPDVWDNLGYCYAAKCSPIKVYPPIFEDSQYTAYLNNGEFVGLGDTPQETVKNAVSAAREGFDRIERLVLASEDVLRKINGVR